jgi:long-subunit fatty acid transport protein
MAVQYFRFSLEAKNIVYFAQNSQKFQPADFDELNLAATVTQTGDDYAWAVNLGALWKASPKWDVGASFRQAPLFDAFVRTQLGPRDGFAVRAGVLYSFHVPDTFSVGVLHRLSDFWHLSFEYDRILYGQLIEDFQNTSFEPGDPEAVFLADGIRLNDVNQLRFGAEYHRWLMTGSRVLAPGISRPDSASPCDDISSLTRRPICRG